MQDFQTFLAPAKLNLFLHIVGQRPDGYHLLQSVFQLIDLYDSIDLRIRNDGEINHLNPIENVPAEQDLTVRAAKCLQQHCIDNGITANLGVDIKVTKRIPMGGGLGGGSTDAATVLLALNHLWRIGLDCQTLMQLGLTLGADVPFFIFGESAWVEGIGEQCKPISLHNSHYVVLHPKVHISTKEIFNNKHLTKDSIPKKMSDFSGSGKLNAGEFLEMNTHPEFTNQLEKIVCQLSTEVKQALDWLKQFGDARMTGSGACLFLELESEAKAQAILQQKPKHIAGFVTKGLTKHPLKTFC